MSAQASIQAQSKIALEQNQAGKLLYPQAMKMAEHFPNTAGNDDA